MLDTKETVPENFTKLVARLERDLSVKHSYLDLPEYYQNSQKMNELSQEISSLEKEYESLIDELSLYDED